MEAAEALRRAAPLRSILSPAGGKRRKSALKRGGGNRSERRIRFCSEQNRENFYDLLSPAKRRFDLRWQKGVEDLKPQELGVECLAYDQRELFDDKAGGEGADAGGGGGKGGGRGKGKGGRGGGGGGRGRRGGRGKARGKGKSRQRRDGRGYGSDGNALDGVSPTKARTALNAAWAAEMTAELSELGFDAVPAPAPGSVFARGGGGGGLALDFDADGDTLMGGGGGGGDEKGAGATGATDARDPAGRVDTVWLAQQLVLARRLRRRAHLVMVLDAMQQRRRPPRRCRGSSGVFAAAAGAAAGAVAAAVSGVGAEGDNDDDDDDDDEDGDFDMDQAEAEQEDDEEEEEEEEDEEDEEGYVEYTKRGWQRTVLAAPSRMRSEEMAEVS